MKRYYWRTARASSRTSGPAVRRGRRVVHLSCHSFTPRLAGVLAPRRRRLLFDPAAAPRGARSAPRGNPATRARGTQNYPYRGTDDGLTTYLRTRFAARDYVRHRTRGNQKFQGWAGALAQAAHTLVRVLRSAGFRARMPFALPCATTTSGLRCIASWYRAGSLRRRRGDRSCGSPRRNPRPRWRTRFAPSPPPAAR